MVKEIELCFPKTKKKLKYYRQLTHVGWAITFSHRAKKVWVGKNVFMFLGSENVSEFVTLEKFEMAF